ncbi:MAG: FG-GAP repeat domain-containing protein [Thermoanaerobaculia bacterium]
MRSIARPHFRSTGPRPGLWLPAMLLAAACAGPETPAGETLTQEFWPTEIYSSEAGSTKKVLLSSFADGPLSEESGSVFLPEFRGEAFGGRPVSKPRVESGVIFTDWLESPAGLGPTAFRESWNRYLAEFAEVLTTEVHTWEVQLRPGPNAEAGVETKEAMWVLGRLADGRMREDRLYLVLDLRKVGEQWRLVGARSEAGRTTIAPGPYFQDVTTQALPPGFDQTGAQIYTDGGPALADFDRDGDIDLFLPRLHAPARLYANDGEGYFDDVTSSWGLEVNSLRDGSNSGLFVDFDADGATDLVVGLKREGLRLFRNEGSFFRDVTGAEAFGGPGEWEALAAADYDGDGLIDVYMTNYNLIDADHQPESYVDARDGRPNALLRNLGDGRFEEVTDQVGLKPNRKRWSYAAAWADYDLDGDMDLYVANDYASNSLYRNHGDGTFEEVSAEAGARDSGNGMGVSWVDTDGDLKLDLYISNMQSFAGNRITRLKTFPGSEEQQKLYQRFSKGNSLLRNIGDGSFEDVTDRSGAKPAFWAWGNAPFDYDADGDVDILVCGGFYSGLSAKDT